MGAFKRMSKINLIIISLFVCGNQFSANIIKWPENEAPGIIYEFKTVDNVVYASNYIFEFVETIDENTKKIFNVSKDGFLSVLIPLDREQQKEYVIPIMIKNIDNPKDKIAQDIHVIVTDDNDNKMKEGNSNIKILKFEGTKLPEMEIGCVFVNDLDDDDLDDKVFRWSAPDSVSIFKLDEKTGMITTNANNSQIVEGEYNLLFAVIEKSIKNRIDHMVDAIVNVSIQNVPIEAVRKSASIRFHGIKVKQFINSIEVLKTLFVNLFETVEENVEIITISQKSIEPLLMDIIFYVKRNHSGDYFDPEFIKIKLLQHQKRVENTTGLKIQMINIDECDLMNCDILCYNEIIVLPNYIPIITNQSSFYGINSIVRSQCGNETLGQLTRSNESLSNVIEFKGNGYAIYSGISHYNTMNISFNINSYIKSGMILYIGPMNSDEIKVGDSMKLQLENELLILTLNFGSESIRIDNFKLPKQKNHSIEINRQNNTVELVVKDCHSCPRKYEIFGTTRLQKLTNPIQLGGIMEFYTASYSVYQGFFGCISNFTINGRILNVTNTLVNSNVSYECLLIPGK